MLYFENRYLYYWNGGCVRKHGKFIMVGKDLIASTGFINSDGVCIPLSASDKIVYVYLREMWEFHVVKNKGEYFESQDTIGEQTNTSRSTLLRTLKMFRDNDVVVVDKKNRGGKHNNCRYLVVRPLNLYFNPVSKSAKEVTAHEQEDNTMDESKNTFDFPPAF